MVYLFTEIGSIILFAGFFAFFSYEQKMKKRIFLNKTRGEFDRKIRKITYLYHHIDLLEFLRDTVQLFFERLLHTIVHSALITVRFFERYLTHIIRMLPEKFSFYKMPSAKPSAPSKSPFVQSITDYKRQLRDKQEPPKQIL